MSEHTPGPWVVRVTRFFNVPDSHQYLVVGTDDESICRMTASEGPEMQKQAMPDARLIAAAPLMYQALEEIANNAVKNYEGSMDIYPEAIAVARDALKAAKGDDDGE